MSSSIFPLLSLLPGGRVLKINCKQSPGNRSDRLDRVLFKQLPRVRGTHVPQYLQGNTLALQDYTRPLFMLKRTQALQKCRGVLGQTRHDELSANSSSQYCTNYTTYVSTSPAGCTRLFVQQYSTQISYIILFIQCQTSIH